MRNSQSVVLQACRRAASAALGLAFVLGLVTVVGAASAQAKTYKETVLCSFTGENGNEPLSELIFDAKGNLYGTTYEGGTSNAGVVFKLNSKNEETVLYSFTGGADGAYPSAGLIFDAEGNLYGTGRAGGASNKGVVFKLNSKNEETVLYSFTGGADGAYPSAGLIFDAKGNLYGTTWYGGASNKGVVFKLNSKNEETVLHSFAGGADGAGTQAGLIFDAKGNLYGTTYEGGTSNAGVVFKLNSKNEETVLYSFTGGEDGKEPLAGLIFDAKGNLYGTTFLGGGANGGVVFKLNSKNEETVLWSFGGGDGREGTPGRCDFRREGKPLWRHLFRRLLRGRWRRSSVQAE